MTQDPASQFVGTALLICKDPQARAVISESLRPLAIRPEISEDAFAALDLLERQKFEAVIVDFQLGEQAELFRQRLQFSRANRTAITFAIAPEGDSEAKPKSTFVLRRPLSESSVCQTLKAAYGMVIRERRRYFRCPVAVPAVIHGPGAPGLLCDTVNISEGGAAIRSRTEAPAAAEVVQFSLPGCAKEFSVETRLCWQHPSGLMGLEFKSLSVRQRAELQDWLARKLEQTLPASVAEMLRSSGYLHA
jgi:CheY-like chemotaxis protein